MGFCKDQCRCNDIVQSLTLSFHLTRAVKMFAVFDEICCVSLQRYIKEIIDLIESSLEYGEIDCRVD